MKVNREGQFAVQFAIRISEKEWEDASSIAERLGLTPSEILRRSLRIALPILRDLNLPGSPKRVSVKADAPAESALVEITLMIGGEPRRMLYVQWDDGGSALRLIEDDEEKKIGAVGKTAPKREAQQHSNGAFKP
jgi:hypothetical protein